jgi:hypothetical protein
MDDLILREYPQALTGEFVTEKYLSFLAGEYQSDLSRMLFATSLCSDDVNISTDFRRVLKRPFTMGGLGGVPFSGYTGMVAFAHHIPDGGDAFIFYGPHIGISDSGQPGRMRRRGQVRETNSCGALMLAVERLRNDSQSPHLSNDPALDYQQIQLEAFLLPHRQEILSSESPIKSATDLIYRIIHRQIHKLVSLSKIEFTCHRLFVLGGVIINTSPDIPDYVDVRHFNVYSIDDIKEDKPFSILKSEAFLNT